MKTIFIAFAIEDETMRNFLTGQAHLKDSPFEYVDMSVKVPYDSDWKSRVRTRIRRSDGVIALISKNSQNSSGQKWEIECAKEEGKKILAIYAYSTDRSSLSGVSPVEWSWPNLSKFINSL